MNTIYLLPFHLKSMHKHMTPTCYIGVNKKFFNLLVNDTENVNIIQTTTIQVVKPKPIVGNSRKLKKPNIDINGESFIFVYLKSGFVHRECHIYGLEHRAGFFDDTENFKNLVVCHWFGKGIKKVPFIFRSKLLHSIKQKRNTNGVILCQAITRPDKKVIPITFAVYNWLKTIMKFK